MTNLEPERVLFTPELVLEPIVPAHATLLFDDLQAPDLYTFIPHEAPTSVEALRARYERWSVRRSTDGREIWLNYAVKRTRDEAYLGTVQATVQMGGPTYVAYQVFRPYRRLGVARTAVTALLRHLFQDGRIDRISALVDTRNEASWKLLESLRFRRMATVVNADHFKGQQSDEYRYELLREEV